MVDLSPVTRIAALDPELAAALDRDGFLLVRGAIPQQWLPHLRAAFDAGETPSEAWPAPRGRDWRHALVDLDPLVQRLCRLPVLLAAVQRIIGGPFFLGQVEGREPRQDGGFQGLHRDGGTETSRVVSALAFLDDFDTCNGATRVVAGSQGVFDAAPPDSEAGATVLSGRAGDLLVFDASLLHGATRNASGARRRSLLITYAGLGERDGWLPTEALRGVRMSTAEVFGA